MPLAKSWKCRRMLLLALASLFASMPVSAQPQGAPYPNKPIKLVVPYAAGGSTDQLARAVADHLGRSLGQSVVVENKPGGNTIVAAEHVAKSPADGYTLFMGSSASLAVNPLLYNQLPYDPRTDFVGISMLAASPLILVVPQELPVRSVTEFIAYAKAKPGSMNYASVGNGNPLHLAGELFKVSAGVDMVHVPYNGSSPALTALIGNQVQAMFDVVLTSNPHIKSGKLRALGVTGSQRIPLLPDVPTVSEAGLPGYEAGIWFAMVAPKATPLAIVQRLNQEVVKILKLAEMRARFDALALELIPTGPEDVASYAAKEQGRWAKLIKEKGIRLD